MPAVPIGKPRIAATTGRRIELPPKRVDPHYQTAEHRAWAAEGARLSGGYCQDPECKTPNAKPRRLFADHIRELRDGGNPFDPANRMMRCGSCHTRKTAEERAARLRR